MGEHNITTCDVCQCRVDYRDSDQDRHVNGMTFNDGAGLSISPSDHWVSSSGHSSHPMPGIGLRNVCSPVCLRRAVMDWLDRVDEKVLHAWNMSKPVPNTFPFIAGPKPLGRESV